MDSSGKEKRRHRVIPAYTSPKDLGLEIRQPENGYRFSVDALLLADFVRIKKSSRVIELGAGCGIISLILSKRFPDSHFTAVEIQEALFGIMKENIRINRASNITPLLSDMKELPERFKAGSFDHVVSNPPFRKPETGRLCLDSQEALSRHEILITLGELLKISRFLLRPGGRFSMVFPAERTAELITNMSLEKLEPKRLQFVHPDEERQARLILAEGLKNGGVEARILSPLFINQ